MRQWLQSWRGLVVALAAALVFQLALLQTDAGAAVFVSPVLLLLVALGTRSREHPVAALSAAVFAGLVLDAFAARLFLLNTSFALAAVVVGFLLAGGNREKNPLLSGVSVMLLGAVRPVLASLWLLVLGMPGFWSRVGGLGWAWLPVWGLCAILAWPLAYRVSGEVTEAAS